MDSGEGDRLQSLVVGAGKVSKVAGATATMERHLETDEVFVLLHGRGTLLFGGNGPAVGGVQPQAMEPGKLYNVKRSAWHGILLSHDASVLLVENRNTARENSEYAALTDSHRKTILELARAGGFE